MHHLTDISIRNFRSCQKVDLALSYCTPIVGYNNAGKSNIMAAIEWLVAPRVLGGGDFFDPDQPVTVDGVIEGLDEAMLA
jgi:putative ATP-dependent endonuclease of OLD family